MSRISPGTMTVALFATMVGLGGAFVVRQHLHEPTLPPLPTPAPQAVTVPIALMDLEPGRKITLNDLAVRSFTPEEFEQSEFAKLPFMRSSQQLVGRTIKNSVTRGKAILPEDLFAEGMGPDLAERLQAGYRAVTVPITNIGAVHSFARSGSFVDVLFRVEEDTVDDRPQETMTLLERVEVLAIDTYTQPGEQVLLEQKGSVTLAVTPHQAKMLKVVEGQGEMSLTLRNPGDQFEFVPFDLGMGDGVSQVDPGLAADQVSLTSERLDADREDVRDINRAIGHASERVTLDDLLGRSPRPKKVAMEVYLGSTREVLEFDEYDAEDLDILRQGGRIQTPIAGGAPNTNDQTVQVSTGAREFVTSGAAGQ